MWKEGEELRGDLEDSGSRCPGPAFLCRGKPSWQQSDSWGPRPAFKLISSKTLSTAPGTQQALRKCSPPPRAVSHSLEIFMYCLWDPVSSSVAHLIDVKLSKTEYGSYLWCSSLRSDILFSVKSCFVIVVGRQQGIGHTKYRMIKWSYLTLKCFLFS